MEILIIAIVAFLAALLTFSQCMRGSWQMLCLVLLRTSPRPRLADLSPHTSATILSFPSHLTSFRLCPRMALRRLSLQSGACLIVRSSFCHQLAPLLPCSSACDRDLVCCAGCVDHGVQPEWLQLQPIHHQLRGSCDQQLG